MLFRTPSCNALINCLPDETIINLLSSSSSYSKSQTGTLNMYHLRSISRILTMGSCCSLQLLILSIQLILTSAADPDHTQIEVLDIIKFEDADGIENEEYAFRAPIKGFPDHVIDMYCANVKLRLYWGVFREEVKSTLRTGMHLRRLARLTRHLYPDIRKVDKPFDGVQLSKIDSWYGVKPSEEDEELLEKAKSDQKSDDTTIITTTESPSTFNKFKSLVKKYAPTAMVGIYTRWRTMWWLMMSCLFAKFYLWDPALDDFIKLQRSLVMYPEFQLVELDQIDCLPIKFFKRLIDTCKVLNPLMNFDFGQLNLSKTWQFKSDKTE